MKIKDLVKGAYKLGKSVTLPATNESYSRLAACRMCSKNHNGRCTVCGCFVEAKVKHPDEHCPIGKW